MNNLIEQLKVWDTNLFLSLNGVHSSYFDVFMWIVSSKLIWLPAIVCILYAIFKDRRREFFFILVSIVLTIVLADQMSSSFFKPVFERLRPSREPILEGLVHLVNGYRGGSYGFVSSHAANSFAFALISSLFFRFKPYTALIFCWAILNSYSRIYLGVHYPLDIICGAGVGLISALAVYFLFRYIRKFTGFSDKLANASSKTTSSGFEYKNMWLVITVLLLTIFYIAIVSKEVVKLIV